MSRPAIIKVVVVHPRKDVRVSVDGDVFDLWRAADLPFPWTHSEQGPYVRVPGKIEPVSVAELILGRPGKLGDKGPFDVTRSNLIPDDGSEADAAGLVGRILSQPLGFPEPDLRLMRTETHMEYLGDDQPQRVRPTTTDVMQLPCGTVLTTHS
jgi:hypothetical protein